MSWLRLLAATLLCAFAWACTDDVPVAPAEESGAAPARDLREWRSQTSLAGTYQLRWRPGEAGLEVNEPTSLEVQVADAQGAPVEGAQVVVRGAMPGHGHGMNREPRCKETGEGTYLVEGFLLHMTGSWELKFDVIHDGIAETVAFELELE